MVRFAQDLQFLRHRSLCHHRRQRQRKALPIIMTHRPGRIKRSGTHCLRQNHSCLLKLQGQLVAGLPDVVCNVRG